MKFNSFIFTKIALTSTLVASGAVSTDAKEAPQYTATEGSQGIVQVEEANYDADLHLDTLDADGHLSILEAESYIAKSQEPKVTVKPKVAEAKLDGDATKSKYLEANYSTTEASHSIDNHIQLAAAPTTPKPKADSSYGASKADKADHGDSHGASKAHGKDHGDSHGASKSGNSFLTKHTTEIEFTFAILVIVVGLIASERFQRVQEKQVQATTDSGNADFGQFEES